jgi:MscS family membrane protein
MPAPVAASISFGERILGYLPEALVGGALFGVKYWQWLGLAALILAGFAFDAVVRTVGRPVMRRLVRRADAQADLDAVGGVAAALGLFGAAVFWTVSVSLLGLGGVVHEFLQAAIGIFTVFAGARFGWRLTDLLGNMLLRKARSTDNKFDDILVPLLRKTAKVFIVAMGIVYGAQTLDINIVPLVTGLGIGGLAFAFAAKDTIENFFGSVTVILDHPFEVGDWVVVDEVEGTVEELGLRSTRIRTFYNSQVTVPNATLVRAKVDNLGRRAYRRWKTTLGVQYDTSPEKLLAFTEGIRELVRSHPYTRKDFYQIWCNDFGDFSLNVLLYMFFQVPDWSTELRERERLFVDIVRLADRLGVQFAFPTQTVHLYNEEHAAPSSHYEIPAGAHDGRAQMAGIEAARAITSDRDWQKEPPPPVDFMVTRTLERGKDHERGGS